MEQKNNTIENKIKMLIGDLLFQNTVLANELERVNGLLAKQQQEKKED